MSTIYFHVGMPKTGTSHIQHVLWDNDELLRAQGVVYPHLEAFPSVSRARNGHFIRHRFFNEEGQEDIHMKEEVLRRNFDIISDLAEDYDRIVLSEEGMWNGDNVLWESYVRELARRNLDTLVVVYLRRQDLFLQSFWAQKVKEFEQADFQEYLSQKRYQFLRFDYYKRLKEIEENRESQADQETYSVEEMVEICGQIILEQRDRSERKIEQLNSSLAKKEETIEKKNEVIRHKQEVIDWETTPLPEKVVRKLKKICRQLLGRPVIL